MMKNLEKEKKNTFVLDNILNQLKIPTVATVLFLLLSYEKMQKIILEIIPIEPKYILLVQGLIFLFILYLILKLLNFI